jgi:hypothetical protein
VPAQECVSEIDKKVLLERYRLAFQQVPAALQEWKSCAFSNGLRHWNTLFPPRFPVDPAVREKYPFGIARKVPLVRFIFVALVFAGLPALAFKKDAVTLGLGYYSQNALGKTTSSTDSSPGILGAASFPLYLKYDWWVMTDWYVSPQFTYTPIARSSAGGSAKTTMMMLSLPVGANFGFTADTHWDWSVGPALVQYTVKGAGGTTVLDNGTTTATFAVPGETKTMRNITLNAGSSFNFLYAHRVAVDMILEGLFSNKRSESIMISYGYQFGGSFR